MIINPLVWQTLDTLARSPASRYETWFWIETFRAVSKLRVLA